MDAPGVASGFFDFGNSAMIEALFEEELADFIGRCRYGRGDGSKKGYRHGHRECQLVGTFGTETVSVPRARIKDDDGKITEWRSKALPRYQRLTKKAEALIASVYQAALVALWGEELPLQRCTVHKHRNLLGHAPKQMHDELTEDCRDMIYADTATEIETRRKAFLRKWRLKCRAVADSLEEAGDRLFAFTQLDPSQWKSARTPNAIERLNEEFRRRIKTQTVLPCAETVPMLLGALAASGQIQMRKVDGWETLSHALCLKPVTKSGDQRSGSGLAGRQALAGECATNVFFDGINFGDLQIPETNWTTETVG